MCMPSASTLDPLEVLFQFRTRPHLHLSTLPYLYASSTDFYTQAFTCNRSSSLYEPPLRPTRLDPARPIFLLLFFRNLAEPPLAQSKANGRIARMKSIKGLGMNKMLGTIKRRATSGAFALIYLIYNASNA